jgi:hypothetical protein
VIRRVILTGGRDLPEAMRERLRRRLTEEWRSLPAGGRLVLVHGRCPSGADLFGAEWAAEGEALGFPVAGEAWPADWDSCAAECPSRPHRRVKRPGDIHHPGVLSDYCPSAGPRRNAGMVAAGAYGLIAFPWGQSFGTWNCVRAARRVGVPVDVVRL